MTRPTIDQTDVEPGLRVLQRRERAPPEPGAGRGAHVARRRRRAAEHAAQPDPLEAREPAGDHDADRDQQDAADEDRQRDPEREVDDHDDERHQRDRERRQAVAALEQHPAYAAGARAGASADCRGGHGQGLRHGINARNLSGSARSCQPDSPCRASPTRPQANASTPVTSADHAHSRAADVAVERVAADAVRRLRPVRHDLGDRAVLEVVATTPVELGRRRRPDRGRRALLGRDEVRQHRLPVRVEGHHRVEVLGLEVPAQRGEDRAGVQRERAHPLARGRARRGAPRTARWRSWTARRRATCRSRPRTTGRPSGSRRGGARSTRR